MAAVIETTGDIALIIANQEDAIADMMITIEEVIIEEITIEEVTIETMADIMVAVKNK